MVRRFVEQRVPLLASTMDTMQSLRDRISSLDQNILDLLDERMEIARQIGDHKRKTGRPILDFEREDDHMESLVEKNRGALSDEGLRAIFTEIISASREMQGGIAVGYLKEGDGACHVAALQRFGRTTALREMSSLDELTRALDRGRIACGVVPSEIVETSDIEFRDVGIRIHEKKVVLTVEREAKSTQSFVILEKG